MSDNLHSKTIDLIETIGSAKNYAEVVKTALPAARVLHINWIMEKDFSPLPNDLPNTGTELKAALKSAVTQETLDMEKLVVSMEELEPEHGKPLRQYLTNFAIKSLEQLS
ncbi:hypothetical protein N9M10_03430 [Hellea sp.]|nr:hypothetical protein [Hellea sp.]